MKKLLSLDGGGIRGLPPALFLAELERLAGKPCGAIFDLVAGTSTGGILACGIRHGIAAAQLAMLYSAQGSTIFPPGGWLKDLAAATGPIYSAAPLEGILRQMLGGAKLSDPGGPELVVPAYRTSAPYPLAYLFTSAGARASAADDFPLWQVARATSAAPVYFAPAVVSSVDGQQHTFVDGGVFANNPSLKAVGEAHRLWPGEELLVISLGTGGTLAPFDLGAGSAIDVAPDIVHILMDATASSIAEDAEEWLGARLHRYDPPEDGPGADTAMDDASRDTILALEDLAARWIAASDLPGLVKLVLA